MELNPTYLPFVMHESGTTVDNQGIDLANHANADAGVFPIPFQCEVVRAMGCVTEGLAGASAVPELRFAKRPTAGSDTSRGDGDIALLNFGVSGVSAQGEVAYDEAAHGTVLSPGQEVVVQVVRGASGNGEAGHVRPMLLVRYNTETKANMTALQETT